MTEKKKAYIVRCMVNMCAENEQTVIVKTTKPHLAAQKAEVELRNNGYWHAKAYSVKEIGGSDMNEH